MRDTKITTFESKRDLDSFLKNHDVLSVQYSHSIIDESHGERHFHTGVWIVWYKD